VIETRMQPCEIPERVDGLGRIAAAGRVVERREERCAARAQEVDDGRLAIEGWRVAAVRRSRACPFRTCRRNLRRQQPREVVRQVQRDASVAIAERLDADPDDFARGRHRVEIGRLVRGDPRRQHFGLQRRRRDRRALQLLDDVEQRVRPPPTLGDPRPVKPDPPHALPRRREPPEDRLIDRLDLLSQLRE